MNKKTQPLEWVIRTEKKTYKELELLYSREGVKGKPPVIKLIKAAFEIINNRKHDERQKEEATQA